jgi:multiple sugar transport system permease protein
VVRREAAAQSPSPSQPPADPAAGAVLSAQAGPRVTAGRPRAILRDLRRGLDKRFFALAPLPGFIIVAAVTFIPVVLGIYLSFTNYQPIQPSYRWAGLVNYKTLVGDPQVHQAIENTVIFAGFGLVIEMILGVGLALLLARPARGIAIFRTLYVLPLMVAGIASSVAWRALLNTSSGWVNYLFGLVGLPQPNWLASPHTAMPSILLADVWSGAPTVAIIVLAGLLALRKDPVEAARVDGASDWQIFLKITLPALRPVLAFAAVFRLVDLFRQIALFQVVTGGGPGLATTVLNFFVYQTTFVFGELGYGASLAVLLVAMMVIPLAVLARFARRRA